MQDAQIFVSYRRNDTRGWLRQLREPLERVFGAERVFVDTRCIEPGAPFPVELQWALERSTVVLALIGPHWVDAEGCRRLAEPGDWVRRELTTSLQHDTRVVPVLLGKATLPTNGALPTELRPLLQRQAVALSEERWDADLDQLIEFLASSVERDPVCEVTMDLRRLLHLIHLHPETARAVGASAGALRELCRITARLAARKRIHDLLHEIEEECLQPLAAAPASRHVAPYAQKLADAAAAIEAELPASAVPFARAQRLRSGLARAGEALGALQVLAEPAGASSAIATGSAAEARAEPPGTAAFEARWHQAVRAALATLAEVLSSLSSMNESIAEAARQLRLADLSAMLAEVRRTLDPAAHPQDRARLADDVAKLGALAAELRWRVAEHGLLQAVDDQLRAAGQRGARGVARPEPAGAGDDASEGHEPAELAQLRRLLAELDGSDVEPMPTLREAMRAGHCLHLRRVVEQLRELAAPAENKAAAAARGRREWLKRVRAQHARAAHQFNDADVELMQLCARLGDLGDSLAHLLDRVGDR